MKIIELDQFEATLKDGKVLSKNKLIFAYLAIFISCLFPLISIAISIAASFGKITWNNDMIISMICFNIFSLILFFAVLSKLIRNSKTKKNIKLWSLDAQNTIASVKREDIINPECKPYQVAFTFNLHGKEYHKISSSGSSIIGYKKDFLKYCDKKILIMYSIKYDEVLILKQKN